RFIHADTELPLLVKIGLAHAQFETIHPFLDGNGRVGRLLITFLLCEQGVLQKPVLYLSWFFKQHRQQYYDELQSVRDAGTWERWLAFFLRGVVEVSGQATDTARRILSLREEHRRMITEGFGRAAANGHRVLEHIYEYPIVSVRDVRQLTGTTYTAANNLVARMAGCGILREFTGRTRHRRFRYQNYIDLFHDAEPEAGTGTMMVDG
ncbi:MAG: Fic family protein, partial [Nitrospinae bacterium]|nr:Fic family protein [Nitrospinota bacterium]